MSPASSKRSIERRPRRIAKARQLRHTATEAEAAAWKILRSFRDDGIIFRRQHPIGKFIVDFCCTEDKLVVELDGGVHAQPVQVRHDSERDRWLRSQGFTVLRFSNGVPISAPHEFFRDIFAMRAKLKAKRMIANDQDRPPHP